TIVSFAVSHPCMPPGWCISLCQEVSGWNFCPIRVFKTINYTKYRFLVRGMIDVFCPMKVPYDIPIWIRCIDPESLGYQFIRSRDYIGGRLNTSIKIKIG